MSDSKHPAFKIDDDKDVIGRLCALSWFDGVRSEYDLLVNVDEDDARELVAKLTAWLDAPRLAARDHLTGIVPVACCYSTGVALIQSRAGEWGVVDADWLSMAPNIGLESTGAMRDWYATEVEARAAYRDETGKVICESCARFIDHDDAECDDDGIYTCADETACSAACASKEPK